MTGMTPQDHRECGLALFEAEKSGKQIGLLSQRFPQMDLDDAYAVQDAMLAARDAAGFRRIGWKIGLTSRAMQEALQITTPDSGVLYDDMLFANGASIPADRFIQPRVEAEIAFILKGDLEGANLTREDVLAATDYVAPALELLDTRIIRKDPATGAIRKVTDTISDNAANGGIVLGEGRFDASKTDLRWMGCILKRDGIVEETGLGAGVLDDPVTGIIWLAARIANYGGKLSAGDIVLSGSFIRPVEAPHGSRFVADYGPFGEVRCDFL
ncbi:2-oxo-hept-3-ene-1,7-dioate hydratase [Aminobacter sp. J15]|jgi:2-oxo-hept-3-ene-1,7-dioate hydratase|nr:2-oxo-hept-3-ene-1,7-dioate hydratase [Aminobacter sp. J44]TWH28830.1 2-oxo-hept-3-ene-1,7-dioate hydratase [Aminobacter sp. J15]